ncbi:PREDICTED: AKT-interacting protein [Thamnophis sirtalis]|uniref:AKT-interacting protein n=1 Tax=Thamnophis sirtalis TaxID=35019 RepID=A0A6I9XQN7_9SAUR|nr:PREDICTED: AKT-interacting protein [Thamnophis sirtalis]
MNPFWSMSGSSTRKKPETEDKALLGELKTSSPRSAPKKQLPSVPKNVMPMTKPASPALSAQSTNGTHASYGPFYLEYSLLAEYLTLVFLFFFTLSLSLQHLIFDLPIFHPLVDPVSGELDVKRAFTKWRRNHNHIWQILMYARRVFYKIDTTNPLNPESAVLYEKDVQLFKSKVVDSVKLCSSHLFDPPKIEDPHAISFSPWNPAIHNEVREKMLTQKKKGDDQQCKNTQVSGLSWVKPGSVQPFSKEEKSLPT